MSSHENRMSSAVSGAPDDHFIPRRSSMVTVLPSALCSKARATFDQLYSKYSRLPGPAAKRCAVAPPAAPPDERLAERPAVLADPVDRLEHERVLADAFGDRRQLALLYERGELRRPFERLRELRRIEHDLAALELAEREPSGLLGRLARRRGSLLWQARDEERCHARAGGILQNRAASEGPRARRPTHIRASATTARTTGGWQLGMFFRTTAPVQYLRGPMVRCARYRPRGDACVRAVGQRPGLSPARSFAREAVRSQIPCPVPASRRNVTVGSRGGSSGSV